MKYVSGALRKALDGAERAPNH